MDPADEFVNLYDELKKVHGDTLSEWSVRDSVQAVKEAVRNEVRATGFLSAEWISDSPDDPTSFGILLGLDLALLDANADTSYLGFRALDYLQVRLEMNGRLNDQTGGILLPRRTSPCRPNEDAEDLDDFLQLLRIPPYVSANLQISRVPAVRDLPRPDGRGLLRIAQLPLLADPADLRWEPDHPDGGFYTVGPVSTRLDDRIARALNVLDKSGAVLAILPEGCLDDSLLERWRELLRATPRPEGSSLTWLLLGTGPVIGVGPHPASSRPPNRAVLVHRNGWVEPMLTQDKMSGFCFTVGKQKEYEVELGGVKRDERISHDSLITVLDSRAGRFAVQVCEDFTRPARRLHLVAAGVTHLLVPVLAAPMWKQGWQAGAGQVLTVHLGAKAAVSNGLAITRFYREKKSGTYGPFEIEYPATTLLTTAGPSGRPDEYLTTDDMVKEYRNPEARRQQALEDALTPRLAEW
ncbi:hypothetical protein [Amycolatopsis sp. BJA-103]|uniref:hypothetical protein n=1 Tax=unclassified Amycolatopsis TaxID=2618356 RepID=UPI000C782EB2|nr:hypothetical protein [Amycolatopsis sp. BJA-103]AUI60148.1 hypothetical protein BKN51_19365 [Amycolatopsis sp. BJA-103]PNE13643.1 hypothetical protein B1H26_40050 [Amycolatopsis sp. BJA-103]